MHFSPCPSQFRCRGIKIRILSKKKLAYIRQQQNKAGRRPEYYEPLEDISCKSETFLAATASNQRAATGRNLNPILLFPDR
jgi:hypothetical protein